MSRDHKSTSTREQHTLEEVRNCVSQESKGNYSGPIVL
jgi:hypothetical protein